MKEVFYPEDRPMKYFDFDDFDDFSEVANGCGAFDVGYYSPVFKEDCWFTITEDGMGWNIYPDEPYTKSHHGLFDTLEDMLNEYVFPDGLKMKAIWENAIGPKWRIEPD